MSFDLEWRGMFERMKVVRLGWPVKVLIPSLIVPSLSSQTRGMTFHFGKGGILIGAMLSGGAAGVAALLLPEFGYPAALLVLWLVGTTGVVMILTPLRPVAFVKPICTRCRLLPVIKEHEAMHMAGEPDERRVWAAMRSRHSVSSLSLDGDPNICTFCPIPKRLREH